MRNIKTYTNIWKVEKIFYAVNDIRLPRPVSLTFVTWFLCAFFVSLFMKGIPPFIFEGVLMNHIAIPLFIAWFMNKKTFDGKKPFSFVKSAASYFFTPKWSVRGKHVELKDADYAPCITVGRAGGRKQKCREAKERKKQQKQEKQQKQQKQEKQQKQQEGKETVE